MKGGHKMVDCKEYTIVWRYNDQHHCDFSGELNFKDINPEGVLQQFKQTDTWKEYSSGLNPDTFGLRYFYYRIEEAKDLSDLVDSK